MARLLYAQSIAFLVLYVVFSSALAAAPPGRARISDAEQQQQPVGARAAPPHGVSALIKPAAPIWPERFSALMFQNRSGALALTTLYYDWKKGRNLNLIQTQLGARGEVWDVEHDNGTSFIFSRQQPLCKVLHFDVGILFPNWLENATLLGQGVTDGFVADVWTKADFINYHNNNNGTVDRPVRWTFLGSGADLHVMKWSPGDTLSNAHWQAPAYCFDGRACREGGAPDAPGCAKSVLDEPTATGRLMRMPPRAARRSGAAAGSA